MKRQVSIEAAWKIMEDWFIARAHDPKSFGKTTEVLNQIKGRSSG